MALRHGFEPRKQVLETRRLTIGNRSKLSFFRLAGRPLSEYRTKKDSMRTFERSNRRTLDASLQEGMFDAEYDYYTRHNRYPVMLMGKPIINIYKRINLQVVLTEACPMRCGFCIERIDDVGTELDVTELFGAVLAQYGSQGVAPNVSITGGEPTLYPNRLKGALDACRSNGIRNVNINTYGHSWDVLSQYPEVRVNLSRHAVAPSPRDPVFMMPAPADHIDGRTFIQCALLRDHIHTLPGMKVFMQQWMARTPPLAGFSFRGLSQLDDAKAYPEEQRLFCSSQCVDIFEIANQMFADPEFHFQQQKIGDHYWFEFYRWGSIPIRLTYSNFSYLRRREQEERARDEWLSRATVVHANGHVYAGWAYDINKVA